MTTELWESLSELPIEDLDALAPSLEFGLADIPLQVGYEEPVSSPDNASRPDSPMTGLFTPRAMAIEPPTMTFAASPAPVPAAAPAPVPAASAVAAPRAPVHRAPLARRAPNPQGASSASDEDAADDYEEYEDDEGLGRRSSVKRSRKAAPRNEERMLRKKSREKQRRQRVNELFDDLAAELGLMGSSKNRVDGLINAVERIRGLKAELAAAREQADRATYLCREAGLAVPAMPAMPSLASLSLSAGDDGTTGDDEDMAAPQGGESGRVAHNQPQLQRLNMPQKGSSCVAGSCQPIMPRAPAPVVAPTRRSVRQRRPLPFMA